MEFNFREKHTLERNKTVATEDISENNLNWIAGFLEGEGYFRRRRNIYSSVGASQKDLESLVKLQNFFGGSLRLDFNHKNKTGEDLYIYHWEVHGNRAKAICRLIYKYMSRKRQIQIDNMLFGRGG